MECYEIGKQLTFLPNPGELSADQNVVLILRESDTEQVSWPCFQEAKDLLLQEQAHFCKAEVYPTHLCGTFAIPRKEAPLESVRFSYVIQGKAVLFLDDSETVSRIVSKIAQNKTWKKPSGGHFFYSFLESLLEQDLRYLERLQERIEKMEDNVLNGTLTDFNAKLVRYRKEILVFYRYYSQLTELGQELQENENGFFEKEILSLFKLFTDRVARLLGETRMLREYAMQVREVYQAQIAIRQNKVMKVLTVVTAVFSPLSLIAAWYGMNFVHMPELKWQYGYPMVIGASALVALVCIWVFKKKKYW